MKIGFIGLSHLGLIYSLSTASKGFEVIAYTSDESLATRCRVGYMPIEEPGFNELLKTYSHRISYTSEIEQLKKCELIFYSLDVLTDERNESDTNPLTRLIYATAPSLASGTTIILLSQVSPGYTRKLVAELTTKHEIKAFYYQVETLVFGSAVQRALNPERFIVGSENPLSPLIPCYSQWHAAFKCPVLVMRYESAELAKIAINFFLVSTVTTTNTLAEVCEVIGADWKEIAPALRLDKRIGPYAYLKPGLGISGGNLERDLVTIQNIASKYGTDASVIGAWQSNSTYRRNWVLRYIHRELLTTTSRPLIAVWGIAYKEDTHSIKNSASIEFIQTYPNLQIRAHDPVAKLPDTGCDHVTVVSDPLEAINGADALLLMTPWRQYSYIAAAEIKLRLKGLLVLDPYGLLNETDCIAAKLDYHRLGC